MNSPFTYEEGSLLVRLLMAHIITDFILQSKKGIDNKNDKLLKSTDFWVHGLYTGIAVALFMFNKLNWSVLALITLSHLFIDYWKIILTKKINIRKWAHRDLWLFIIDQVLHIMILVIGWLIVIDGFEKMISLLNELLPNYRILLRILGYLIAIGPVTYLIKYLTLRWADEVVESDNSLQDAGKWIGILERLIVITLVLIEQYTAIGFLVTAKSILRLIDKPDIPLQPQNQKTFSSRKHTEYVLIGTFLSFGSAVTIGLLINWLLKF